jgi:Mannosylglycerate hydrolase MGH1-like glycoside hydrolase domain
MNRREFLSRAGQAAGTLTAAAFLPATVSQSAFAERKPAKRTTARLLFETSDLPYQATYSRALDVLSHNIATVSGYELPVLIEGSNYGGIWLECAPHEGLVYSLIGPDVARNNHFAFFALQREDGQLPCWIRTAAPGFGQIQMVVPIAATAWELAQQTGDHELLDKAYRAGSRWDAWLRRYRDTRHTGLCEGFCTWDTGHDNSPRWAGIPNRCPDADARKCPDLKSLPRLCPDLSATVYGGRIALAAMARELGKNSESDRWLEDAASIRSAILEKLYVPDDAAFYDLDAHDHFIRVRGDVISRVIAEHVPGQRLFETIYERKLHNPAAFWAPYPLPSIALDDPAFVRPIPRNSWGGASQALTALRAPRWMEYYGVPADLAHLMQRWVEAIVREGKFLQQMDPITGKFTPDAGGYSPAALVLVDFTWRLAGVRLIGEHLEWNVRPPDREVKCTYRLRLSPTKIATIKCESGRAELFLNERLLCKTGGTVRLLSDNNGNFESAVGTAQANANVLLEFGAQGKRVVSVAPNRSVNLI